MPRATRQDAHENTEALIRTIANHEILEDAELNRLALIAQRGRRSRSILITRHLRALIPFREEASEAEGIRALSAALDRAIAEHRDLGRIVLTDLIGECLREVRESDTADERVDDIDCIIAEVIPFRRLPELYAHYTNVEEHLLPVVAALKGARKTKLTEERELALRRKFVDKLHVLRPTEEDIRRVVSLAWPSLTPINGKQLAAHARNVREGYAAANEVIRCNGRLAISIAKKYHMSGLTMIERVAAGQLGILKSVYRFEPPRGFKFSTYATWWIRHAIRRTQSNEVRTIRIPVHQEDILFRLRKLESSIVGTGLSDKETAHAIGTNVKKLLELRPHVNQPASYDAPLNLSSDHGVMTLDDFTPDKNELQDERIQRKQRERFVHDLLAKCDLKSIERVILARRYGLQDDNDETLREIGESYNLSRERIRQLEAEALKKLRRHVREHQLADTV